MQQRSKGMDIVETAPASLESRCEPWHRIHRRSCMRIGVSYVWNGRPRWDEDAASFVDVDCPYPRLVPFHFLNFR